MNHSNFLIFNEYWIKHIERDKEHTPPATQKDSQHEIVECDILYDILFFSIFFWWFLLLLFFTCERSCPPMITSVAQVYLCVIFDI